MKIKVYIHGSKESFYEAGVRAGLGAQALEMFRYAGCEHEIEYSVDQLSGIATAVTFDGRPISEADPTHRVRA